MPTDGERYIYVGNGNKVAVKAIGLFRLQLDSGCTEERYHTLSNIWRMALDVVHLIRHIYQSIHHHGQI